VTSGDITPMTRLVQNPVGRSRGADRGGDGDQLETRRCGTGKVGSPTVRTSIDTFLDTPKAKGNANTAWPAVSVRASASPAPQGDHRPA
jgi:hypothetical protein